MDVKEKLREYDATELREESFKKERIVNCAKELLKIRLEYISVY